MSFEIKDWWPAVASGGSLVASGVLGLAGDVEHANAIKQIAPVVFFAVAAFRTLSSIAEWRNLPNSFEGRSANGQIINRVRDQAAVSLATGIELIVSRGI